MEKLSDSPRSKYSTPGVYKITCIATNKFYIGSSSGRGGMYARLKNHLRDLRRKNHSNKYLQRSFSKHLEDTFFVEVLDQCLSTECVEIEQYWIDLLKPHYNLCKRAGSTLGRKVSLQTRSKISISNKRWNSENPEFRKKISDLRKSEMKDPRKVEILKERAIKLKKEGKFINRTARNKRSVKSLKTGRIYSSVTECWKDLGISNGVLWEDMKNGSPRFGIVDANDREGGKKKVRDEDGNVFQSAKAYIRSKGISDTLYYRDRKNAFEKLKVTEFFN